MSVGATSREKTMNTHPNGSAAPNDKPQRGWWRRNWKWFVPAALVGCLAIAILGAAVFLYEIHHRDPYVKTMAAARENAALKEALGEPIKDLRWLPAPLEGYHTEGDRGEVNWYWEIAGPKGECKIHVQGRRIQGKWQYQVMEAELPGHKKISLIKEDDEGGAPLFKPQEAPKDKKPDADAPPPNIDLKIPLPE
jgi:hypothetical protein